MKNIMHPYDIRHETDMVEPLDFNRRSRLKDVDKCFKSVDKATATITKELKGWSMAKYAKKSKKLGRTFSKRK